MKVKKEAVVALFEEIGSTSASGWAESRMKQKIQALPKTLDVDDLEDADNKALAKKLLKAVKNEEEIVIVSGAAKEEAEAPAPKKKGKKAAEPVVAEEEDDEDDEEGEEDDAEDEEEDEDDEEEDEAPAPAKKKASAASETPKEALKKKGGPIKSAGGEGKPGVIASIVEFLSAASEDKPISKKGIVEKLAKRFPDRSPESMMRTINVQVPNRLKVDKKLNIAKNDKGYFIAEGGKKAKKAKDSEDE